MKMRHQLKTFSGALSNTTTESSNDISETLKEIENNFKKMR